MTATFEGAPGYKPSTALAIINMPAAHGTSLIPTAAALVAG